MFAVRRDDCNGFLALRAEGKWEIRVAYKLFLRAVKTLRVFGAVIAAREGFRGKLSEVGLWEELE